MDQEQNQLPNEELQTLAQEAQEVQALPTEEVTEVQEEIPIAEVTEEVTELPTESVAQETQKQKKERKPKKPKKEAVIYEYIESFQHDGIMRKYHKQDKRIFTRLIALGALLLISFFYDVLYGILPTGLTIPVLYLLISDALCLIALALALKPLLESVKGLLEGKLQPTLIVAFAYVITAIYQITCAIAGELSSMLYASWYLIALCFATVFAQRLELRRELYSFVQMSEEGEKILLQQKNNICYPVRAGFFSDFYHRISAYPAQRKQMMWYFIASGIVPILFLIMTLCMGISAFSAFRCAYLSFLLAMPSCFFFFYTLPQYFLAQSAYLNDSMLAGEEASERLCETKRIDLTDAAVLDREKVTIGDLKFYGNFRIDRAMYYLASALAPLDCSLSDAAKRGCGGMGYSQNSVLSTLEGDGLCTLVDDKLNVDFGTADYMRRKGYLTDQTAHPKAGEAYLAVDAKIVATMQVRYAVKEAFATRLAKTSEKGIDLVVRTMDPILTDMLLRSALPFAKDSRLFLQKVKRMPTSLEEASADAMTTKSDELPLIDLVLESKKVKENTYTAHLIPMLSMIGSLFLMAVLQNPVIDTTAHLSWVPTVYHALVCGANILFVYFYQLRKPK